MIKGEIVDMESLHLPVLARLMKISAIRVILTISAFIKRITIVASLIVN